jgi:beta-lactamase class A
MKLRRPFLNISITLVCFFLSTSLFADFKEFQAVPNDESLQAKVQSVADETLKQFPKLTADNLAITIIDLSNPAVLVRASLRGGAPFYPASVVKLFYMAEVYHQVHDMKIDLTPELQRALKEMIHVSDNDATAFLLDVITDTCGGPELSGPAFDRFLEKRGVVNRWFGSMGYDVNAMAKPWSFGPFGRDVQVVGPNRERRNRATSDAVAALMLWIVRREAVSRDASEQMMRLLRRNLPQSGEENQVIEFLGETLPAGASEWSKAGWTSEVRHDAAYVELPNGKKFIEVVFTRGPADDVHLLPEIGKKIVAMMQ